VDTCDPTTGECVHEQGDCVSADLTQVPRGRYILIDMPDTSGPAAVRVRLSSLGRFRSYVGEWRWLGPPQQLPDEDRSHPGRTSTVTPLQCDPHFQDWSGTGVVAIFGAELMPGSSYAIDLVDASCWDFQDPSCYSDPLVVQTGKWGDVMPPFDGDDPGAPQPDFHDITGVIKKFLAAPDAPLKASAQLQPNVVFPNRRVSFKDVAACVSAFIGDPYPFVGPCPCPSTVTCGGTACTDDGQCGADGFCIDGACTDACGRCSP
jgi:hypothetical protein